MINLRETTLVPSLAALAALKLSGTLDDLAAEYFAEKDVVSEYLGVDPARVSVVLSPAAVAIDADALGEARNPAIRTRLEAIHVILPDPAPQPTWRELGPSEIGVSRHGTDTWLWAGGDPASEILTPELGRRRIPWSSPIVNERAVPEAIALRIGVDVRALVRDVAAVCVVVDVDRNGRPFPAA